VASPDRCPRATPDGLSVPRVQDMVAERRRGRRVRAGRGALGLAGFRGAASEVPG
jgi:hypothetical protein